MRRRRSSHGFTLVELMIVVAIVGVLTAVAGYTLGGTGRGLSAEAFARSTHFLLLRARADAISDNTQRRVSCTARLCVYEMLNETGMNPSGAAVWQPAGINIQGGNGGGQVWAFNTLPQTSSQTIGAGPIAAVQRVVFRPDGTSSGGTYYFSDRSKEHRSRVFVYRGTGMSRLVAAW